MTNDDLSVCPRCGKQFSCSKSGKCWCYDVYLPLDKLEEMENLYDTCLCPACLNDYAHPSKPKDGKYSKDSFVYTKKQRPA